MTCLDLAARLAARGKAPEAVRHSHFSSWCEGPTQLLPEEGSSLVQGQMQGLASAVLKNCTLPELREVCRQRGLSSAGFRDELVLRLSRDAVGSSEVRCRSSSCHSRDRTPRRRASCSKRCTYGEDLVEAAACLVPETPQAPQKTRRRRTGLTPQGGKSQ